jgi:MYXO-CTERM domain-containing protein
MRLPTPRIVVVLVSTLALGTLLPRPARAATGADIASIAVANLGLGACSTNTGGGTAYGSSCTGNGGQPEYWCADFALWVWGQAGVTNLSGLDAAAGSFYTYGQNNGTLHATPSVGDAVVFNYQGGGYADHVALVTQVNSDGTIETVSGDWNGTGATEAAFSSTSSVVLNSPAYASTEGTTPGIMGMTISGYISPVGLGSDWGASFVGQSFPFATSALTMVAGETVPSYIELKNTGTKAWDSSTHLGTTQPRDRESAFADSTWIAANRPAGVSGTVAPGDSYKFTFDLHAPTTPGTYYEYFGVVEDGVAWFSDPGQGGPVDDDLEVQIVVVAGDAGAGAGAGADAGAGAGADAGAGAGAGADAGSGSGSGSASGSGSGSGSGSASGSASGSGGSTIIIGSEDAGTGGSASGSNASTPESSASPSGSSGGCSVAHANAPGAPWLLAVGVAVGLARAARRRRR